MTSPTGRIVSRVGVRVLPNTSTFRRSLDRFLNRMERTLRVEIPTTLSTAGLDAELRELKARIERTRPAKIPVEYAKPNLPVTKASAVDVPLNPLTAAFARQVRTDVARVSRAVEATIPVGADGTGFRRQVAAQVAAAQRTARMQVPVDSDLVPGFRQRLSAKVAAATRGMRHTVPVDVDVDRRGNAITGLFSTITSMGSRIGSAVASGLSSGVGALGSLASSALSGVTALAMMAVKAALLAPLLAAVAGAATAAFGAITAAALGLPVVLASLLGPIGAIALGMEGIQKAAATLKPEFDRLRAGVSNVFATLLPQVLEPLKVIFPTLQKGFEGVAVNLTWFTGKMIEVITTMDQIGVLENIFQGIQAAIVFAMPGIQAFLESLLRIAGTERLYVILGDTISVVSQRFADILNRARQSGALEGALLQLRDVLIEVTELLGILAQGALEFFEGAGPGITGFFHEIGEALRAVDWASLGETFGGLLERVGKAIRDIPPETWQRLGQAIADLALKFVELIESGGLESMITNFARLVEIMPGVIDFLVSIASLISSLIDPAGALGGAFEWIKTKLSELGESLAGSGIKDSLGGIDDSFDGFITSVSDKIKRFYEWLGISSPSRLFAWIGHGIVDGLLLGLAGGPGAIWNKVKEIGQSAKNALADAKDLLFGPGADLVEGFIRGIGSKIGNAARKAAEMAKSAYDAAKAALWSSSPSRLFAQLGRYTAEGYIVGLEDRHPAVDAAIARIFGEADRAVDQAQASGAFTAMQTQAIPTALDIADAFLRALSRVAVGTDDAVVLFNQANAQLARR